MMTHPGGSAAPSTLVSATRRCGSCRRLHQPKLKCWTGDYAAAMTETALAILGRSCWICGELATTLDHYLPRSLGGDDALSNLRPACLSCNSRRGDTLNPFPEDAEAAPSVPPSSRWSS